MVRPYMLPLLSSTKTQLPSIVGGTRRFPLVCSKGLPPLRMAPVEALMAQTEPPVPLTDPANTTPPALAAGIPRGMPAPLESVPNEACQVTDGFPQPGLIAIKPGANSSDGATLVATSA